MADAILEPHATAVASAWDCTKALPLVASGPRDKWACVRSRRLVGLYDNHEIVARFVVDDVVLVAIVFVVVLASRPMTQPSIWLSKNFQSPFLKLANHSIEGPMSLSSISSLSRRNPFSAHRDIQLAREQPERQLPGSCSEI